MWSVYLDDFTDVELMELVDFLTRGQRSPEEEAARHEQQVRRLSSGVLGAVRGMSEGVCQPGKVLVSPKSCVFPVAVLWSPDCVASRGNRLP